MRMGRAGVEVPTQMRGGAVPGPGLRSTNEVHPGRAHPTDAADRDTVTQSGQRRENAVDEHSGKVQRQANEDDIHIYMLAGSPMGFIPFFQVKQIKSDPLICTHFTCFSRVCVTGGLTTLTGPEAPSDLGTGLSEQSEAVRCPVRPGPSTHTPQMHGFTTNVSQYFNLMFSIDSVLNSIHP